MRYRLSEHEISQVGMLGNVSNAFLGKPINKPRSAASPLASGPACRRAAKHHLIACVYGEPQFRPEEGVSHVLDLSEGSSKLIPIHEEPNHQIVHLFRLGKADRPTH